MNTENAIKTAVGFFITIVVGALISAVLGGVFAAVIAGLSPEFVRNLFSPAADANLTGYAAAVGAIWGLFIGAAVSGFACGLAAVLKIIRLRIEHKSQPR